jgi:hypothetical protein
MSTNQNRIERRDRQAREVENSQRELRASIETTRRLLDQSDDMLKRHRRERGEEEA